MKKLEQIRQESKEIKAYRTKRVGKNARNP